MARQLLHLTTVTKPGQLEWNASINVWHPQAQKPVLGAHAIEPFTQSAYPQPVPVRQMSSMVDVAQHTTQFLLLRSRAGDSGARAALVARIEPLLRRFAHGRLPQMLRHEQDTSDLVQLTWLKVLNKLDSIDLQEPGDFFSYLRTVLLNALREALRKHGRSQVVMRFEFGMSFAEIADEFGESADTMRMRVNRAIARIAAVADGS